MTFRNSATTSRRKRPNREKAFGRFTAVLSARRGVAAPLLSDTPALAADRRAAALAAPEETGDGVVNAASATASEGPVSDSVSPDGDSTESASAASSEDGAFLVCSRPSDGSAGVLTTAASVDFAFASADDFAASPDAAPPAGSCPSSATPSCSLLTRVRPHVLISGLGIGARRWVTTGRSPTPGPLSLLCGSGCSVVL